LKAQSTYGKLLLPYESFGRDRLELYRHTSAPQMHDWLKEEYVDISPVNQMTIINFVKWVRHQQNLPYGNPFMDYSAVEESAYGLQGQVDFGVYNMRTSDGKRVKSIFSLWCFSVSDLNMFVSVAAQLLQVRLLLRMKALLLTLKAYQILLFMIRIKYLSAMRTMES
jgi:hypothetical protein